MNQLKPLFIAQRFIQKVLEEKTGSREELAKYLGITPRWVTVYKNNIEVLYKVEINFCKRRKSYVVPENEQHKLPPPPPLFRMIINFAQNNKGSVGILNRIIFAYT